MTGTVPLVSPPVEKPVPTQLVAFALPQVSWLVPPSGIDVRSAPSVAPTDAPTVTVAPAGALVAPPTPVQVTEYAVVTPGITATVPFTAPPVENPTPVQLVASVLLQVKSLEPPSGMSVGTAASAAVTAGPTVIVCAAGELVAPPAPSQVTEYTVVTRGDTETAPLVRPPVEKPVPVQLVASVLPQVSWLVPPSGIWSRSAESVATTAAPTVTVASTGVLTAPPSPSHTRE